MKRCCKCKKNLSLNQFYKCSHKKDGYQTVCKSCTKINNKTYRKNNPGYDEVYRIENEEKEKLRQKIWYSKNKDRVRIREAKNRKQKSLYHREWRKKNKSYIQSYLKHRRETEPEFKILIYCRKRIKEVLNIRRVDKVSKTINLIGCTPVDLRRYLESRFVLGMSWDNYGKGKDKWHIDHIKPCASFDLTNPEQQKQCFHYTNLQPLWEKDNCSKGSLYEGKRHRIKKKK